MGTTRSARRLWLIAVVIGTIVTACSPGAATRSHTADVPMQAGTQTTLAVYLGDDQRDKILKLAPGASAPSELPVAGVDGPGHLAIDADDNLYVTMMGRLVEIAKGSTTAEPVPGGSDHVGGLAVDDAGNLYASDVGAKTVSRRPAGGGEWVPLPLIGLLGPTHVAVAPNGDVVVVDQGRKVLRLAAT